MDSLVCYTDSEDEEEIGDNGLTGDASNDGNNDETYRATANGSENEVQTLNGKRKISGENQSSDSRKAAKQEKLLPLPETIKTLFKNKEEDSKQCNDPEQHQGRIRSFAHMEGNWATHIGICYEPDYVMEAMIEELFLCLRPLEFQPLKEYHISLSRTVSIRHHWIQSLTESLQKKFNSLPGCLCEINSVKLYSNDEKTRSFLALDVSSSSGMLGNYTHIIDDCFEEFRLPKYYSNPSFHISIGWCLHDVIPQISQQKISKLQEVLERYFEEHSDLKFIDVGSIQCKTGNKFFNFPLK